jgi:hypothetical protein
MPTKRTFDLVLITALALHPAVGLVKMWAARHLRESSGATRVAAEAVKVAL